jgi:hypothetical protein
MDVQNILQLGNFLLLLRLALVALLYVVILQVVGVARRDLRQLARVPVATTRSGPVVGHLVVIDCPSGTSALRPGDAAAVSLKPGDQFNLTAITTIGRAPTNDIVLESKVISSAHARIVFYQDDKGNKHDKDGPYWVVQDLGSRNGTKVNGQPVTQPIRAKRKDTLDVGDVRFMFDI